MVNYSLLLGAMAGAACADILWDGRFNNYTSSTDLDKWSFSNEVGAYQWYIHGTGNTTDYVNFSADDKNPADTGSKQGAKITLDTTAVWNNDGMWRTELIPQTSAAINSGKVYYHFSMKTSATNSPNTATEHQIAFFESHFTEMKYGLISGESGSSDTALRWEVGGTSEWNVTLEADVWHNIAYEIDFDGKTVTFWHSTGADDLTKTAGPITASTSSNGADWHLGVLRLAASSGTTPTATEDWYFSGVYIESGSLTTTVASPGDAGASSGTSDSSSAAVSSTAAATSAAATSAALASSAAASSTAVVSSPAASSTVASSAQAVVASSSAVVSTTVASATSAAAVSSVAAVESSAVASSAIVSSAAAVSSSAVLTSASAVATSSDDAADVTVTVTVDPTCAAETASATPSTTYVTVTRYPQCSGSA